MEEQLAELRNKLAEAEARAAEGQRRRDCAEADARQLGVAELRNLNSSGTFVMIIERKMRFHRSSLEFSLGVLHQAILDCSYNSS